MGSRVVRHRVGGTVAVALAVLAILALSGCAAPGLHASPALGAANLPTVRAAVQHAIEIPGLRLAGTRTTAGCALGGDAALGGARDIPRTYGCGVTAAGIALLSGEAGVRGATDEVVRALVDAGCTGTGAASTVSDEDATRIDEPGSAGDVRFAAVCREAEVRVVVFRSDHPDPQRLVDDLSGGPTGTPVQDEPPLDTWTLIPGSRSPADADGRFVVGLSSSASYLAVQVCGDLRVCDGAGRSSIPDTGIPTPVR
jgi:hypothetical protein